MTRISHVSVIGSGVLGAQIAFVIAHAGFKVTAWDLNDDAVEAAKKRFDIIGKRMIEELDYATEESISIGHENLTLTTDLDSAAKSADLIIEAVPEKLELKRSTWEKLGASASENTIFCTNTSSLLGSEIADASGAPERFLNTHFANRVWVKNIVEIMPNPETDLKYRDIVEEFAREANLEPVVMKKEQRAYLLNTMMVPFLQAAQYLYVNDVADIEQIDKDWKIAMSTDQGPFEIMDMIGLRSIVNVAEGSKDEQPEWKKEFTARAKRMIEEGRSGAGDGEGFYKYDSNGNIVR
ncbi:3-hydroxyacyl-CoA dehydrogenase [Corynebacterium liangguodongii]|uniref:3-hydroxyacyl-CoA dehydrogenase n=1 Tax=Corynebacterium liangguodongii TaxID=2079535 RepID=A0A2S0WDS8_9CORY|nr:3-hydroxyacyl-CoA dehydrogenase [Corynebacterium liangguodongii]AWB83884.1 3-hydroxyacyl-CoA dehydrogenase [Corynebacterium liangguodongii]PWB99023.1 3-hydroxyacyl-CoA dehydrogenase [Corynebacterium liangguodongii]